VYNCASCLRLGQPFADAPNADCTCNHANGKRGADITHPFSCPTVRKHEVSLRHDSVKVILHTWANRLGCPSHLEQQSISGNQQRADVFIVTPDADAFYVDITIPHPTCPTYLAKGTHHTQLKAASIAAAGKHNKHDKNALDLESKTVACAIETYGGWHAEAIQMVKRLASFADENCPWASREAQSSLISAISCAVQTGNYRIVKRVHANIRASGRAPPVQKLIVLPHSPQGSAELSQPQTPAVSPRSVPHTPQRASPIASPQSLSFAPGSPAERGFAEDAAPAQSVVVSIDDRSGFGLVDEQDDYLPDERKDDSSLPALPPHRQRRRRG
jgi:hypothetical protein